MAIGVSAILLDAADLDAFAADGMLTVAPTTRFELPGNELERATLGYLHANCGHCHNPSASGPAGMHPHFALSVHALGDVTETATYKTAIGAPTRVPMPLTDTTAQLIVDPGDPDESLLYIRASRRAPAEGQMPPLATERVDSAATELLATGIRSLPP